jgi:hypothetical protein
MCVLSGSISALLSVMSHGLPPILYARSHGIDYVVDKCAADERSSEVLSKKSLCVYRVAAPETTGR